jgi:transposase-like protein
MEKEKPPVFGMIERGGQVVINLLANVKQKTIEPLIKDTIDPGTLVYTDEYSIYARLQSWGYSHKPVNHGRGEFARDEDGDGLCEVHVHTMEGFWSLLRSWLRPHRGISQEKLPLYLGFFEFVHNVRKRGKALLGSLIELLVSKDPGSHKSVPPVPRMLRADQRRQRPVSPRFATVRASGHLAVAHQALSMLALPPSAVGEQ